MMTEELCKDCLHPRDTHDSIYGCGFIDKRGCCDCDYFVSSNKGKVSPKILDPCCGSRMFWFDKKCPGVQFSDNRELDDILCDGRKLEIKPDTIMDFRKMNLQSNQFKLVVFDPPHMKSLGKNSWMAKKYGVLGETWRDDLRKGFSECFRVLEEDGILIFKWNEHDILVREVLELTDYKPLFGHKSGKLQKTHWITFMKSSLYLNKESRK